MSRLPLSLTSVIIQRRTTTQDVYAAAVEKIHVRLILGECEKDNFTALFGFIAC